MPTVLLEFRNAATLGEVIWGTRGTLQSHGDALLLIWVLFAKILCAYDLCAFVYFCGMSIQSYIKIFQPYALVFYSSPVLYNSVEQATMHLELL